MKPTYEQLAALLAEKDKELAKQDKRLADQDEKLADQDELIKKLLERVAHLESRLNKNSKNSSKPPSSDQKPNRFPSKKKENRPYHPGASRQLLPANAVNSREERKIEVCSKCGSSMIPTGKVSSWQQIELPEIKPLVHQIDLHTCRCPNCCRKETPKFKEKEQHLMGPRLEALVNLCLGQFRQGHRVVREFISILVPGLKLSQGLISKVKARAARSLDKAYKGITDHIFQRNEAIHIDATGWRHQSKNTVAIVIRAGNFIRFALTDRQNGDTLVDLMENKKICHLVSDRGLAASKIDAKVRQYCLTHLLRNIQGLAEHRSTNLLHTAKLGEIYDALQALFKDKHRLNRKEISLSTWRQYGYATWVFMEQKLEEILLRNPGENLRRACNRMLKGWHHFKTYLRNQDYPMTNNPAEEALRNLVISRKLCFGSRSSYGRRWREVIQSCVETLRRQGRSVWDFLTEVINSSRLETPYPSI